MPNPKKIDDRVRISLSGASAELQARMAKTTRPGSEARRLMELGLVMEKLLHTGGIGNGLSSTVAGTISTVASNPTTLGEVDADELSAPVSVQPSTKTGANFAEDLGWSPDTFTPPGL